MRRLYPLRAIVWTAALGLALPVFACLSHSGRPPAGQVPEGPKKLSSPSAPPKMQVWEVRCIGECGIPQHMSFRAGTVELTPEGYRRYKWNLDFINRHIDLVSKPEWWVEIRGFSDGREIVGNTRELSDRRAWAVYDWFVSAGVSPRCLKVVSARIEAMGPDPVWDFHENISQVAFRVFCLEEDDEN